MYKKPAGPKAPLGGELERLLRFYEFIYERQEIWHRRFVEKTPPPWTEDKILQKYRFCNVYRRLDRGTQYILDRVISAEKLSVPTQFLNVIGYRFFNIDQFFEKVLDGNFFDPMDFQFKKYESLMDQAKEEMKIFSTAYMTTQQPFDKSYRWGDKHVQILHMLQHVSENIDEYMEPVFDFGNSAKKSCQALSNIKMIGPFLAYEIWTDLTYLTGFPHTDDDYAHPGPGAIWGLRILFEEEKISKKKAQGLMRWLRDAQDLFFRWLLEEKGKSWEAVRWKDYHSQFLSLRNIEHCLCEYRKYTRLEKGEGKKRYFKPQ